MLSAHQDGWMQDEQGEHREAEASARRAVQLMEAEFGEENPRNATAYGTLAAILKCGPARTQPFTRISSASQSISQGRHCWRGLARRRQGAALSLNILVCRSAKSACKVAQSVCNQAERGQSSGQGAAKDNSGG